jgi:hypothetical protein
MPSNQEEQNRSQKMQDDRLNDRNRPSSLSKRNASTKQQTRYVEEVKNKNQKPLHVEFFNVLPRAWKGVVIGIFVGLIPLIATIILRPEWNILGLIALVTLALIGFAIGKITQTKKLVRGRYQ